MKYLKQIVLFCKTNIFFSYNELLTFNGCLGLKGKFTPKLKFHQHYLRHTDIERHVCEEMMTEFYIIGRAIPLRCYYKKMYRLYDCLNIDC